MRKLIWATLNEIMNKTTHKHNLLPKEFSENNPEDIIKNPQEIANKFNEYFINVGPGIANRLPTTNKAFNEYLSTVTSVKTAFLLNLSQSLRLKLR